jgi:hypothetical protein
VAERQLNSHLYGEASAVMSNRPINQAHIRPSMCPDCLQPMHCRMSVSDENFPTLLHVMFVCECCGRFCDHLVAKSMLTISPMQVL